MSDPSDLRLLVRPKRADAMWHIPLVADGKLNMVTVCGRPVGPDWTRQKMTALQARIELGWLVSRYLCITCRDRRPGRYETLEVIVWGSE